MICDNYYNYNKSECLDQIPDGYYLNDTILKTIDKCDVKCKLCSKESNEYNQCLSCNNNDGYYSKVDDYKFNNNFVDCYNNLSNGYYLDEYKNIYQLCYSTCKKCVESGDEYNNKCLECMDNTFQYLEGNVSNCYNNCSYYFYFDSSNKYHCTSNESCPIQYNKKILEKRQCIDDCSKDKKYKYEFNNTCYEKDLIPTFIISNISNISIDEGSNNCLLNWNTEKFFKGYCNSYLLNHTNPFFEDEIIKNIGEDIINKKINLYNNENNSNLKIKKEDTLYQITTSDKENSNKETNISSLILGDCEDILKEKYKIDKNKALIILKIEYYKPENLIPIIGYEIFDPDTKEKLNLTYCNNVTINLNIPVSIDENNLFKYDPNNEYYSDECNPYTTKDGTDILLNDRHNEYNNNNLSICENNCTLKDYEKVSQKVVCECKVKYKQIVISEIMNDSKILSYNFTEKGQSTMLSMKCVYTLFTTDGFLSNIASYILIFFIIFFIFSIIFFYKCGYYRLEDDIKEVLEEKENKKDTNINRNETIDISHREDVGNKKIIKKKK